MNKQLYLNVMKTMTLWHDGILTVIQLTLWPLASPPGCPLEDVLNCASRFLISCWNSSRSCSRSTACSYKDAKGKVTRKLALCTLEASMFFLLLLNRYDHFVHCFENVVERTTGILEHHFKSFFSKLRFIWAGTYITFAQFNPPLFNLGILPMAYTCQDSCGCLYCGIGYHFAQIILKMQAN